MTPEPEYSPFKHLWLLEWALECSRKPKAISLYNLRITKQHNLVKNGYIRLDKVGVNRWFPSLTDKGKATVVTWRIMHPEGSDGVAFMSVRHP